MQQQTPSTLEVIYENWRDYQEKLRNAIASLTNEQLSLQPAAHMWPLGQIVQHIIGSADIFDIAYYSEKVRCGDYRHDRVKS